MKKKSEKTQSDKQIICRICGSKLKRLTNSHLRKHGITHDDYIAKYEPKRAEQKAAISFFNNFYITKRSRWVEYKDGRTPYTVSNLKRGWGLCDNDLKQHLAGKKGLAIYFPQKISKFIGFDVDTLDIELLNKLWSAIIALGVKDENILISFSGNKGYHIDIFLSDYLDQFIINEFYKTILFEIEATTKQVELRGGGGQAYKLPLGYHYKTGKYCYICDEYGNKLPVSYLQNITKASPEVICDAVEINFVENKNANLLLNFEDLDDQVFLLESHSRTNELNMQQVERLIDNGIHEIGERHVSIRTIAAYCKDVKGYCLAETIEFIEDWIYKTWDKKIIDVETLQNVKHTVKSVYSTNFIFRVRANTIKISLPDIKEVFSVKTRNKLQTQTLRRLYYSLLLHSKAYADSDGVFYMSYAQITSMGGAKKTDKLIQQIKQLEKLGKLLIVERNRNAGNNKKSKFKKPNKYKLVCFEAYEKDLPTFNICGKKNKCKDCYLIALCRLAPDKERRQFIKGKDFKKLPKCEFNQ